MTFNKRFIKLILLSGYVILLLRPTVTFAQSLDEAFYDIGSPNVTDYFVDSSSGNDNNDGKSRNKPKKTVSDIWNEIPEDSSLSRGYRINLLPGSYNENHLPNYWEKRTGTLNAPIIVQAADGYGTVKFSRDINMANVSYFYLLGIDIKNKTSDGYGDAFHCESCDHILLRGNSFNGAPNGRNGGGDTAHETVKFNQSQYIYIENNNIQGADDNGIDWVGVQYGHIMANRIHDTAGWCTYVKGGSSYILIESNKFYNCGEGGVTAGQGTGFEFMVSPWDRFEANYVKIVNNIIHDIEGAAIGINGGYGILAAHNTAYKIGTRSHLLEVVFGERSCDGDIAACTTRRNSGGWGPIVTGSENNEPIGNKDIIVANNIFYNPAGTVSASQHFAIYGPRAPSALGIPSPQVTDDGLVIKGNLIWNGTPSMFLGIEDSGEGCQSGNPTCNQSQLISENAINTLEPDFIAAAIEDFRPVENGALSGVTSLVIPNIPAIDTSLNPISEGNVNNTIIREFSGASTSIRPPGAIVSSASSVEFPDCGAGCTSGTPGSGGGASGPTLNIIKVKALKKSKKVNLSLTATATDSDGVLNVNVSISAKGVTLASADLTINKGKYSKKLSVLTKAKKLSLLITALDNMSNASTTSKTVKVVSNPQ